MSSMSDTPFSAADERMETVSGSSRPWRLVASLILGITAVVSIILWYSTETDGKGPVTMVYQKHHVPPNHSYIDGFDWIRPSTQSFKLPATVEAANLLFHTFRIEDAAAIFAKIPAADMEMLFNDFLATIGSRAANKMESRNKYDTAEEHKYRLGVFAENIAEILSKNAFEQAIATRPDHARFGISVFADWTKEEFTKILVKPPVDLAEEVTEISVKPEDQKKGYQREEKSQTNDVGGYTHYERACVNGHNLIKYTGKTAAECATLCDSNPACVAFEYGVDYGGGTYKAGDCQPQDSTDSTNCDGKSLNLDLYVSKQVNGYKLVEKGCVNGHNMKKYTGKTALECAALCAQTKGCVSFEFGVDYGGANYQAGDCQPNDSTDYSQCDGEALNLDLYIKTGFDIPCSGAVHYLPRQQGACGSCWAYSSAGTIRHNVEWATGKDPGQLSTQYLKDCYPDAQGRTCADGVDGCCGGWPIKALTWAISDGGFPTKEAYPDAPSNEMAKSHTCKSAAKTVTATKAIQLANGDETGMANAYCKYGPQSICVQANALQHYSSGVMSQAGCNTGSVNHAIELVGLDAEKSVWIVRNSWGTGWGVTPFSPYYRAGKDPDKDHWYGGHALLDYGYNTCQIGSHAVYTTGARYK